MKSLSMLRTTTPKCTRYYINGTRVSRDAYEDAQFWRRLDTFHTTVRNGVVRHRHVATPQPNP